MRYLFIFYWISFCCSCYLPPAVAGVTPAAGSSNIVSNSEITLTFTQPMNRLTVEENFTLTKNKQTSVKGIFRWQARQVTFTPEQFLIYGNKYYITVGENAENSRGVDLDSSFSSMFTAGRILSAFRLTYSSLQGITNLTNRHTPLCFKFCRQIRLDNFIKNFTVNPAPALNFFLTNNNTAAAVFFTAELQRGQHYKVKLQQEMGDIYGNTLNSSREWHFTAGKHFYNFQLKKVLLDSGTPLKEDRIISNAALDTDFRFVFSHAVDFTSFIENVIFADNLQGELLQTNPSNIIFTPDRLTGEKLYTVRIKPNLKDRHGNLLGQEKILRLFTGAPQALRPVLTKILRQNQTEIEQNAVLTNYYAAYSNLSFVFSQDIDPVSAHSAFTLSYTMGTNIIAGPQITALYCRDDTVTIDMTNVFPGNTYCVSIAAANGSGLRDRRHNYIKSNYNFYFKF